MTKLNFPGYSLKDSLFLLMGRIDHVNGIILSLFRLRNDSNIVIKK